jgi:ABC-type spermidine/putrescine transport systems, ATPase components
MKTTFQLFDSFNARHSSYEEIAQTFVSNEDFFNLAENNHSFILGPRGCGKTTLFKMLTASAQHYWVPTTEPETQLKETLPFIAIYIPSDELWKDQLKAITHSINKSSNPELSSFITNALINLNILSNFCTNIKNYIEIKDINNQRNEYKFCLKLIKIWKLEDCVATLSDVHLAINVRKEDFLNTLKAYLFNIKYGKTQNLNFENYFHADFIDTLKNGILAFEDIYFNGKPNKWALCFDELELVSDSFINLLLNKLRTTPSNIVFKLSSGPLTEFQDNITQAFHDYKIIKMWPYSYQQESRYLSFCKEVALKRIINYERKSKKENSDINFDTLLGALDYRSSLKFDFDFEIDENVNEGDEGSLTWFAFRELAKNDKSFAKMLQKKEILIENPIPPSEEMIPSFYRKVKELAINRLIFNKYKDGEYIGQRSRKEYLIYYGTDTIFRVCEGNPRFIINIIHELLSKGGDSNEFSPELQSNVIKTISSRFNAMLNTYPTSAIYDRMTIDLKWLIQKIGNYFDDEINIKNFKVNPASSFLVKTESLKPVINKLINIGVGLGAFIKIDKNVDDIDIGDNTRFRLSYLLHPEFRLPLRLYSSVKLNNIIHPNTKNKSIEQETKPLNLFEYED